MDLKLSLQTCPTSWNSNQKNHGHEMDIDMERSPRRHEGQSTACGKQGFTDPDLLTISAEAPTLSKLGRHGLLQLACSHKFKLEVGDVSTAFLQGDKKEHSRDVYLEPTADLRTRLGIERTSS